MKSVPWPGESTLEIAKVWVRREWGGLRVLDDLPVIEITSSLDGAGRTTGSAFALAASRDHAFIGFLVNGIGFVLDHEEASTLAAIDGKNAEVLFPYLNGSDLNSHPAQAPSRTIINFWDWPLERAQQYPDCLAIVAERVKPTRSRLPDSKRRVREAWWRFEFVAPALRSAIEGLDRALAIARVSKTVQPVFVSAESVFSEQVVVFAYDDNFHFGLLSSAFHWWWAVVHASTMRTDLRYTPTDCFETFAQPLYDAAVEAAGKALDEHRAPLMIRNDEGLTKTYNRVHNPDDESPGIPELRELHIALDLAVRDAYGWSDLDLDHGFHDTPQGRRFTLGPAARTEVLDRLLELNHQRYAEEVAAGLHDKKSKGRKKAADTQPLL